MPSPTPHLQALAARLGILPGYMDQTGRERRVTSDETRVALIGAMGYDASTEERARRALERIEERDRRRVMAPVRVVHDEEAWHRTIEFRVPRDWRLRAGDRVSWRCELRAEDGTLAVHEGVVERGAGEVVDIGLAPFIGAGYHDLRLELRAGARQARAAQRLIVTPAACVLPARRSFGIIANLYSLRGAHDWGVGNLGDLARLCEWSASRGAAFVGVNPLHALRNAGHDISPYRPVSRLYRNEIYLDIEAIPELAESEEARALLARDETRAELARLRASDRVRYERIAALERPILLALHRAFALHHRGAGDARGRAYARWLEREGDALTLYATFRALEAHLVAGGKHSSDWHTWPTHFQSPSSAQVAAFRESHHEAVDLHRWLQFELDRQLGEVASRASEAGLSIGLYQDLAIGTAPDGSDCWAYPALFARGVSVGAPPDDYSATGQNWGLPPLDPHRLHEDRYAYWIALVRAALRHAGALRIDHVLGLFRQFWIPDGTSGRDGAYVRFPTNDLLGILALESARHRAVIVGEDLGTVPQEVPGTLRKWGVLGSRVMLFERDRGGGFRAASTYEPHVLATADTHDMVPLAGFWQERDIDIGREVGVIATDDEERAARAARARDRRALLARLAAAGALRASGGGELSGPELRGAVHRFLCGTPALLVGLALDDLTGEVDPVNIPGVGADRFPSWTRRMRVPLESLPDAPDVDAAFGCERPRGS
ncbi:MAG TPA: 4-alpha-glucanotransferase [Gemmatimonadaceae bacterium]